MSETNTQGQGSPGGQGRLADFKAEIINDFVEKHNVKSAAELGCGEGDLLSLCRFGQYVGFDISMEAVTRCRQRHAGDPSKAFLPYDPPRWKSAIPPAAEMALSLEVIFHLMDDNIYETYLHHFFQLPTRFAVILSNDTDVQARPANGLRFHRFSSWVASRRPDWRLVGYLPSRFPFDPARPNDTSVSDFYFFSRGEKLHPRFAVFQPDPPAPRGDKDQPGGNIRDLLGQARQRFDSGAREETRDLLLRVLALDPFNQTALNNLGLLAFSQGDLREAESLFKRLLAYDPSGQEARSSLAKLYVQERNWTELRAFARELDGLRDANATVANLWPAICEAIPELRGDIQKFSY